MIGTGAAETIVTREPEVFLDETSEAEGVGLKVTTTSDVAHVITTIRQGTSEVFGAVEATTPRTEERFRPESTLGRGLKSMGADERSSMSVGTLTTMAGVATTTMRILLLGAMHAMIPDGLSATVTVGSWTKAQLGETRTMMTGIIKGAVTRFTKL